MRGFVAHAHVPASLPACRLLLRPQKGQLDPESASLPACRLPAATPKRRGTTPACQHAVQRGRAN
eukprot:4833425-Amphidinium_carterae.1